MRKSSFLRKQKAVPRVYLDDLNNIYFKISSLPKHEACVRCHNFLTCTYVYRKYNSFLQYKLPESSEAKRELSSLSQAQTSLSKAIALKQKALNKMANNNFDQAQQQYLKLVSHIIFCRKKCQSHGISKASAKPWVSNFEAHILRLFCCCSA